MKTPNYDDWLTRKVTVDILRLDKENPRLPVDVRKLRQDKIREHLILNEQVEKIAKLIASEGFIPFEPIYVVKEGNFFTVLEGNRRTCALQVLRDPSKAPVAKQRLFKKLSKEINHTDIEKISVIIAPSRAILRKILYLKHADEAQKKWSRQQKHRFIAEAIFEGKSINFIAEELKEPISAVSEAVLEVLIQAAFLELDLPSEIEEIAVTDKFPLSTVTRIIGFPEFRKYTGIKIDGAVLKAEITTDRFKAILKKIVTDLVSKTVTSRTLETASHISTYVDSLKDITTSIENETNADPFAFTPPPSIIETKAEQRQEISPRKREMLIPKSRDYTTGVPKLDILIQQGQAMSAGTHTLAASLLLRTILELAVVRIFEVNNAKQMAINERGRTLQLSKNLQELVKKTAWFSDPSYCEDLKRFCDPSNSQYIHIETLNRYTHGQYTIPDKETLRTIWLMIEPLVGMCSATQLVERS